MCNITPGDKHSISAWRDWLMLTGFPMLELLVESCHTPDLWIGLLRCIRDSLYDYRMHYWSGFWAQTTTTYTKRWTKAEWETRCHKVHFQLRGGRYMQFTFNKTCFSCLAAPWGRLLIVTVKLDEVTQCFRWIDAVLLVSQAVYL